MRFKDKVVVVTGGAAGFGRGIAERFATEGAAIVLADVEEAKGEATARALNDGGANARFVRCDVSNDQDMANLAAAR